MTSTFRFGEFTLDSADRRLRRGGVSIELNARYLDALALLVREAGALVTKERFLQEVWRGVPVTDEALTQCVRTLRRQLGDEAGRPRFIETVPKHGYRFVAPVASADGPEAAPVLRAGPRWRAVLAAGCAGTVGAGVAGTIGGMAYGSVAAAAGGGAGIGGASVLLVLLWLTVAAALTGGAGVSFGIAAAGLARARAWRIAGGAAGGCAIGGAAKLLGVDAFHLLLGRAPDGITGAGEGLLLGGAVGIGAWLADAGHGRSAAWKATVAGAIGAAGGVLIPLAGGRLMGGSLMLLAGTFPGSQLRWGPFGADGPGGAAVVVAGGLEGALFAACIVGAMAMALARRRRPFG